MKKQKHLFKTEPLDTIWTLFGTITHDLDTIETLLDTIWALLDTIRSKNCLK